MLSAQRQWQQTTLLSGPSVSACAPAFLESDSSAQREGVTFPRPEIISVPWARRLASARRLRLHCRVIKHTEKERGRRACSCTLPVWRCLIAIISLLLFSFFAQINSSKKIEKLQTGRKYVQDIYMTNGHFYDISEFYNSDT